MSGTGSGLGGGRDRISLGFLFHRLVHCTQAEERRDFLCEDEGVRSQWFAALQNMGGFERGSLAACASDERVARLVACLALQAKLVRHCAYYADAYLALLLPHARCSRVAALLSLLAGCGGHEGLLPEAAEAPSHLRLLTALAGQLGSSVGAGRSEGAAGEAAVSEHLAHLLASCFSSIVEVTAAVEAELRQGFERQLAAEASSGKGGRKGKGQQPTAEQLQTRAESFVRARLPVGDIAAALGVLRSFAPRHMAGLLSHAQRHSSPLIVSLLQLDLLTGRLPPKKQPPLVVLGALVQHGALLGMQLHASLLSALAGNSSCSGASQLLQLLSTSKAALRCLSVAARCKLPLGAGQVAEGEERKGFVAALLCTPYSGANAAGIGPTCLRLLWQLAVQQAGACGPAARRACDILLWCLPPPFPELEGLLQSQAAVSCPPDELAQQLQQAGSTPGAGRAASPFWRELARALVTTAAQQASAGSSPAPGGLQQLQQLLAADEQSRPGWKLSRLRFEAEQRGIVGPATAGSGGSKSVLSRIGRGTADLEAVDGFRAPLAAQHLGRTAPDLTPATNPGPSTPATTASTAAAPPAQPAANGGSTAGSANSSSSGVASQAVSFAQRRLELLKQQLELKRRQKAAAAEGAGSAAAAITEPAPPAAPEDRGAAETASAAADAPAITSLSAPSAPNGRASPAAQADLVAAAAGSHPALAGIGASPAPAQPAPVSAAPACQHIPTSQPQLKPSSGSPAGSSSAVSPVGTSGEGPSVRWDAQLSRVDRAAGRCGERALPSWAEQAEAWWSAQHSPSAAIQADNDSQSSPGTPLRHEHPSSTRPSPGPAMAEQGQPSAGSGVPSDDAARQLTALQDRCLKELGNASQWGAAALQHGVQLGLSAASSLPAAHSLPSTCQLSEQERSQQATTSRLPSEVYHTPRPAAPPGSGTGAHWRPPPLTQRVTRPQPAPQSATHGEAAPSQAGHPSAAFPRDQAPAQSQSGRGPATEGLSGGPTAPFGAPSGAGRALFVPPGVPSAQAAAGFATPSVAPPPATTGQPQGTAIAASAPPACREPPGCPSPPMPGPEFLVPGLALPAERSAAVAAGAAAAYATASQPADRWQDRGADVEDMEEDGGPAPMQD
ncbi:hypothetical protein ABPG75_009319 [Micractinium tetrahymenae]